MKNKVSEPGDSIFKKKGFFIALYSCLGAVMVLALVISFTNLMGGPDDNTTARALETEAQAVGADTYDSYLVSEEQAWKRPASNQPSTTDAPSETTAPRVTTPGSGSTDTGTPDAGTPGATTPGATQSPYLPVPAQQGPAIPTKPSASPESAADTATDSAAGVVGTTDSSGASGATGATGASGASESTQGVVGDVDGAAVADGADLANGAITSIVATGVPGAEDESGATGATEALAFSPFSETDKLIWPVYGDIAMVFSTDKLVYDPTLDQYRTNDDLRIAAQEGTPVKACADGQVLEVANDQVYGNYVTIDHGNGWVASYGQLMDGVLVNEGEIVKAGQVIGGVGKPSYFGSLNGTHVNLRVTKEDEPVDPRALLADGE